MSLQPRPRISVKRTAAPPPQTWGDSCGLCLISTLDCFACRLSGQGLGFNLIPELNNFRVASQLGRRQRPLGQLDQRCERPESNGQCHIMCITICGRKHPGGGRQQEYQGIDRSSQQAGRGPAMARAATRCPPCSSRRPLNPQTESLIEPRLHATTPTSPRTISEAA